MVKIHPCNPKVIFDNHNFDRTDGRVKFYSVFHWKYQFLTRDSQNLEWRVWDTIKPWKKSFNIHSLLSLSSIIWDLLAQEIFLAKARRNQSTLRQIFLCLCGLGRKHWKKIIVFSTTFTDAIRINWIKSLHFKTYYV